MQSGGARGLELRTSALHKDGVGYKKIAKTLKIYYKLILIKFLFYFLLLLYKVFTFFSSKNLKMYKMQLSSHDAVSFECLNFKLRNFTFWIGKLENYVNNEN